MKKNYARHWGLVAAAAAALLAPRFFPARGARPAAGPPDAGWYLVLRLPLLTDPDARARLELERMKEWLDALEAAGFAPIRLSRARALLADGKRLPGKPVVLVIEPGYRKTFEAVHPYLDARGVPSTWLVDRDAVERDDERYVSRHALARLRASRLSETGFLENGSTSAFRLAGAALSWSEGAGRAALNRGAGLGPLNRLNVNFSWTGAQLVSRLEAETPVTGPTRLTAVRLYGKLWGVTRASPSQTPGAAFGLEAPFSERSASLAWQGTEACRDLDLRVTAAAVYGDVWIYLRSDRAARRGVRVGFTPQLVLAEQWRAGGWKRVGSFPRAAVAGAPLRSLIRLKGPGLTVAAEDGAPHGFDLEPGPRAGVILLQTTDKVRGVAGVRGVELMLNPS